METFIFSFSLSIFLFISTSTMLCLGEPILNSDTDTDTDKQTLISFKKYIKVDPHAIFSSTNWSNNTSVCNWVGVQCGLKHRRVTVLNLSGYDLAGTVAPHLGNLTFLRYLDVGSNNFTGVLPFELSKLRHLKVMNVSVNSFTGGIPTWLGSLPQLEELYMSNNSFSGRIPASLFNNSKLQILSMSFNLLDGNIPKEIGNSSSLKDVRISNNNLSGNIPEEIGNISSLQMLYLRNNELSGSIPSPIFNVSSMREIRIANNRLSGWLPSDMCNNMPNIIFLSLSWNQLEGQIPSNIWKCRNLETLSLSLNNFSDNIPFEIGSLGMLRELYLGYNNFRGRVPAEIGNLSRLEIFNIDSSSLTGNIPSSIFNISSLIFLSFFNNSLSGTIPNHHMNLPQLKELYLDNNKFTGVIPSEIGNLSNLDILTLSGNQLTGIIPKTMGELSQLYYLALDYNHMIGEIPSSICNLTALQSLYLSNNSLEGSIPQCLGKLSRSLQALNLEENHFHGLIPATFTKNCSLKSLSLNMNKLEGALPQSLAECRSLQVLDIGNNILEGSFPFWIQTLAHLRVLVLRYNNFSGTISPTLKLPFLKLQVFDISHNAFNGCLPAEYWNNFKAMMVVQENRRKKHDWYTFESDSQTFTLKGNEILFERILTTFTTIDLSSNRFSGKISNTIGDLISLMQLNLSHNFLTGRIPPSLGNVSMLESLDLSSNQLVGEIPVQLTKISSLSTLNLSWNNLSGHIPQSGGQFSTFENNSYIGNPGLCGFPLAQKCEGPSLTEGGGDHGGLRVNKVVRFIKYTVPSLILLGIVVIVIFVVLTRRPKHNKESIPTDIPPAMEWRRISYIELERGTSCFSESNLLGRGSYGSVYEATLSDGMKVAVKVFNQQVQRSVRSFDTETEIMSAIRHRNLVRLIGCCSNKEFKALILTYMPNGSLDKWLYPDASSLDLIQRLNVAIDVAVALEYLHHGYTFPVVHCDVKPSNVLLDEDMVAHLADFGISKLFDGGEAFIQTQTLATIGYAAPEYGMEGKVSTNGDVYSFGIMLLEMLTGKTPTNDMFGGEMSIKEWVSEAIQQNTATRIVAVALLSKEDQHFCANEQCVRSMFELAMKCLAISADERINMIEAAATLHKIKATMVVATKAICSFY